MKALVKTAKGEGNIEVREVPKPVVTQENEVLIRVSASGVCGTDLHILHDEFIYWPPVILGHEFSGRVADVGKAVTRFRIGDRVVAEPHTCFCGKCELCRTGNIHLCESKRSPGWGMDGAFTDYIVMPELFLHRIPDNLSDPIAALTEPTAIVVNGVLERGGLNACDTVAIIGVGPIALLSVVVAKAAGAKKIIILGTDADEALRFPVANKLGVDLSINVMKHNSVNMVMEQTDGKSVDLVIEASGAAAGINTGIAIAKKRGRIAALGLPTKKEIPVCWSDMVTKVLDVAFCFSSSVSAWEKAITILASSPVDLNCLISHKTSIDNWEKVFDDCERGNAIKAIFVQDHSKNM